MDRKAVAREFTAAADTQFGGAANPFREARLDAIILDAVTIWGHQLLPVSMANALVQGVKPLLGKSAAISREHCGRTRLRCVRRW
jgi:hypothetical protein